MTWAIKLASVWLERVFVIKSSRWVRRKTKEGWKKHLGYWYCPPDSMSN